MKFNKNKIKELRYTDYQVVAERSVGVKAANTVFNEYNQTIFAHDLKWFVS